MKYFKYIGFFILSQILHANDYHWYKEGEYSTSKKLKDAYKSYLLTPKIKINDRNKFKQISKYKYVFKEVCTSKNDCIDKLKVYSEIIPKKTKFKFIKIQIATVYQKEKKGITFGKKLDYDTEIKKEAKFLAPEIQLGTDQLYFVGSNFSDYIGSTRLKMKNEIKHLFLDGSIGFSFDIYAHSNNEKFLSNTYSKLYPSDSYLNLKIGEITISGGFDIINLSKFDGLSPLNSVNRIDYNYSYKLDTVALFQPTMFASLKKKFSKGQIYTYYFPDKRTPILPEVGSRLSLFKPDLGQIPYSANNDYASALYSYGTFKQPLEQSSEYLLGLSLNMDSFDFSLNYIKSKSPTPLIEMSDNVLTRLLATGNIALALAADSYTFKTVFPEISIYHADISTTIGEHILKLEAALIQNLYILNSAFQKTDTNAINGALAYEFYIFNNSIRTNLESRMSKYLTNESSDQNLTLISYIANFEYETQSSEHFYELLIGGEISPKSHFLSLKYKNRMIKNTNLNFSYTFYTGEKNGMYGIYSDNNNLRLEAEIFL